MDDFVCISGLPRSGSTLLANLLNQNPNFFVSPTSGLIDLVLAVRQQWDTIPSFKTSPDDKRKNATLKGLINSFYSNESDKVVFDRSRAWPHLSELLIELNGSVKIIACVRDIRDILASWEKLWRSNQLRHDNLSDEDRAQCATIKGRVEYWMRQDQTTGLAYNWLKDAIHRGFSKNILLVDYDDLTTNTTSTIKSIYDFVGCEYYTHNTNNITQTIFENDFQHGFIDLHTIKNKIIKNSGQWKSVLGADFESLNNLNFWKNYG